MANLLVVEDDPTVASLLRELLEREGYAVTAAASGPEALLALDRARPDLVLLDLMLPGLPGEAVLPRLRGVPALVLSAKADVDSKVSLLLGGAADYMTKPFDSRELLARVAVALRRYAAPGGVLEWNGLRLDPAQRLASAPGGEARLTPTECAVLRILLEAPGQVVPKSRLLDRISLDAPDCTESSLKMHVSHLRRKLRDIGAGDPIEAVWGIGFRVRSPGD